jgi:hypothetical protein
LTVHFKDPENTFEYYSEPVVTNFEPNAGPSVGGTQIVINGYGFTPRRDENGIYFIPVRQDNERLS